jgi:hypothetical protein
LPFTNQDPNTEAVMQAIKAERDAQGKSYTDIVNALAETFDYTMTADQYRACEQGLTRRVPLVVILAVGHILMMPSELLLPLHNTDEYRFR